MGFLVLDLGVAFFSPLPPIKLQTVSKVVLLKRDTAVKLEKLLF